MVRDSGSASSELRQFRVLLDVRLAHGRSERSERPARFVASWWVDDEVHHVDCLYSTGVSPA